ncbi:Regulator of nonsense-mediated decay, UPF3 [Gossypium australe]|uniref:Regulator of nonsense-mediated decay, UPF3 n=2 Tax=Gossypium TaxID=3633 RepID=A0A5B6WC53_9ROSI|nr:Regulator of nonsense-mediated decay, UPF3 [Gossypium australe]
MEYEPLFIVLTFHKLVRSARLPLYYNLHRPPVIPAKLTQGEMKGNVPSGSSGHNIPSENGSNRHFDQHPAAHNMKEVGSVT